MVLSIANAKFYLLGSKYRNVKPIIQFNFDHLFTLLDCRPVGWGCRIHGISAEG